MPRGGEQDAVAFYEGVLGIPHVDKPPHLAQRGGCWFEAESVKIHLGIQADFVPATKAHTALVVDDLAGLLEVLESFGILTDSDTPLEGFDRVYVSDPFGNRLELMQPLT
jgi:predicted enzyme related to lactoylglutathione lyase